MLSYCVHDSAELEVHQIPVLQDNYIYILHDKTFQKTAVVDPTTAQAVRDFLQAKGWGLDLILNTHHHGDHVGGNVLLKHTYGCRIYASQYDFDRIPGCDVAVQEGAELSLGALAIQVWETPGHTLGHIVYTFPSQDLRFCGDTLFALGCGRLFEGTAAQMWQSLTKLLALADQYKVLCAHEYTLSNARFVQSMAYQTPDFAEYLKTLEPKRAAALHTVPSRLGDEKRWNPFLLAVDPDWCNHQGLPSEAAEAFAVLRSQKDVF